MFHGHAFDGTEVLYQVHLAERTALKLGFYQMQANIGWLMETLTFSLKSCKYMGTLI
jgi:hypothetical protein